MGTQILFIFCCQLVELFASKNKGGPRRRQVLKKLMISHVWCIITIIMVIYYVYSLQPTSQRRLWSFMVRLLKKLWLLALICTFVCRSIDHDNHTFVVHYDTYNSDATLSLDAVLPLGKYIYRGHTICTVK